MPFLSYLLCLLLIQRNFLNFIIQFSWLFLRGSFLASAFVTASCSYMNSIPPSFSEPMSWNIFCFLRFSSNSSNFLSLPPPPHFFTLVFLCCIADFLSLDA